jgi:hypothetical protein
MNYKLNKKNQGDLVKVGDRILVDVYAYSQLFEDFHGKVVIVTKVEDSPYGSLVYFEGSGDNYLEFAQGQYKLLDLNLFGLESVLKNIGNLYNVELKDLLKTVMESISPERKRKESFTTYDRKWSNYDDGSWVHSYDIITPTMEATVVNCESDEPESPNAEEETTISDEESESSQMLETRTRSPTNSINLIRQYIHTIYSYYMR